MRYSRRPRNEYREGAIVILWTWVMRQLKHALNMQQTIFLYWVFHDDAAVGLDGRSYESIVRAMFDKVYYGAATTFVLKFYDTDGNDVIDEWVGLYIDVQSMIMEVKEFIDNKNKADDCPDNKKNRKKSKKRKRNSADSQEEANPSKRRRRKSSLTF